MKNTAKDLATSLTALIFVVISIAGLTMLFYIFDIYIEDIYKILGFVFILTSLFFLSNWKNIFISSALLISAVSLVYVINTPDGANPKKATVDLTLNSSADNSFIILGNNITIVKNTTKDTKLNIKDLKSIKEIANNNQKYRFKIVNTNS